MACTKITRGITAAFADKRSDQKLCLILTTRSHLHQTRPLQHLHIDRWENEVRSFPYQLDWLDSSWEGEFCRVAESHSKVRAYVKNHNLGLLPTSTGPRRKYRLDFIVLVDDGHGDKDLLHLVVEIKGYRRVTRRKRPPP